MPDERKVNCLCGLEMAVRGGQTKPPYLQDSDLPVKYRRWYQCDCGWKSPVVERLTESEAIEAAYLAATSRPPNLPIDYKTIYDMTNAEAVWRVDKDNVVRVVGGFEAWQKYNDKRYLYFAGKPTPADIDAASKERA